VTVLDAAPRATGRAPSPQAPAAVVMVRPHRFVPNPQTAADNAYQLDPGALPDDASALTALSARAHAEVTAVARRLRAVGVRVHLVEDVGDEHPDSVFPNNWLSTHPDGRVVTWPMHSPNRRGERREDVLDLLRASYVVDEVVDLSPLAEQGVHLEGTGALVLDHVRRVAYVALSRRADADLAARACADLGHDLEAFVATDAAGEPIYHTNVMATVGTGFSMVCLEAVEDPERRRQLEGRLTEGGRDLVRLTRAQVADFAGNALELTGRDGPVLAISARGWRSLRPDQRAVVTRHARPLPLAVPTLELAGGSVRCTLAGVHLRHR